MSAPLPAPCSIAVAAARTADALVMDPQLDLAQRALSLDDRGDRSLSLTTSTKRTSSRLASVKAAPAATLCADALSSIAAVRIHDAFTLLAALRASSTPAVTSLAATNTLSGATN